MASNVGAHMATPTSIAGKDQRLPQFPPGANASLLLEKAKLGLRRSTPDSEALASSDDEQDSTRYLARNVTSQPLPKPVRRPSWANDTSRVVNRKSSVGTPGLGLEAQSPGPTVDNTGWGAAGSPLARVNSNGNSFPWGSSSIWTNDGSKPPARLSEMTPGTNDVSDHGSAFDEPLRSPGLRRDSTAGGPIPFAIPLKPTLKAYRSQSYSVGQMDQELNEANQARQQQQQQYGFNNRTRSGTSYSNLSHRGSRPSMMGEYPHDSGMLEQLREVDDDEESYNSAETQPQFPGDVRSREQLERENALLRENNDLRQQLVNLSLSAQGNGRNGLPEQQNSFAGRRGTFNDAVLEDAEDLGDDTANMGHYGIPLGRAGRRMSEYHNTGMPAGNTAANASNRAIEIVKRNHWQSSLGFSGIQDQPQSRRHSFADVPKRQASLGSIGGEYPVAELGRTAAQGGASTAERGYPTSAYSQPRSMTSQELAQQSMSSMSSQFSSPPPSRYANHPHGFDHISPRNQSLYMVTFKASRAEFYYVPQGVGMDIKAGDLVIVEADRGNDLGTVVQTDVPWAQTKQLKDHYAEEHYRWLMMFSRRRAESGQLGPNPGATTSPNGRDNALNKDETDVRPKMIKRLAQPHEIQSLKDKEANEAKAKRICQVKADEHQLDMEILDAEFQMDWKKLTFYYYADSYINFNSLVTDLFKTYKTRIWMSAINPASFMTPTAGLAPPAVIGPGAILAQGDPRNANIANRVAPSAMSSRSNLASPSGNGLPSETLQYWNAQQQQGQLTNASHYYENKHPQRDEPEHLRYGDRGHNGPGPSIDQQRAFAHSGAESAYGGMPASMYAGNMGMSGNGVY